MDLTVSGLHIYSIVDWGESDAPGQEFDSPSGLDRRYWTIGPVLDRWVRKELGWPFDRPGTACIICQGVLFRIVGVSPTDRVSATPGTLAVF